MFSRATISLTRTAVSLSALSLVLVGATARAQVTYDAQIPFNFSGLSSALVSPRGVAVAPDGTVYLTDIQSPTSGRVLQITPSGTVGGTSGGAASLTSTVVTLAPTVGGSAVTLKNPTAVAVDSTGALYIADAAGNQVLKLANPETSAAASAVTYPGTETPSALAVDASNNLYIADSSQHAIYEVTGGTAIKLNIPSGLNPVGIAVDSSGNVYFADAVNSYIYEFTGSGTTTFLTTSNAGTFSFAGTHTVLPVGMGFDPAGNLYILDSDHARLIEVNPSAPSSNYLVPFSSIGHPGSLAVSSTGNLYLSDDSNQALDELFYNNNPVNFGSIPGGTASPTVNVNYYFNTGVVGLTFYQSVQGDSTGEFVSTSNVCGGGVGSSCTVQFEADYLASAPGLRVGAWGITDSNNDFLTVPSIGVSQAASLALYPGIQNTVFQTGSSQNTQTLYEPQGLAISGNGGTLIVSDEGGILNTTPPTYVNGAVWAYTNGTGTPKKIGSFPSPMGIALDANGKLYVADYSGTVTVILPADTSPQTWTGPGTVLNVSGVTLNHPIALVFDPSGNLYIGDTGPLGIVATAQNPGYIVKVPADGGPAVRLNYQVNGEPIIYPEALATDYYGNLYIADGGDGYTSSGNVDVVAAATGSPVAFSFGSFGALNQPSALSFDAANDLYVLDGYNQRILVAPVTYTGTVPSIDSANISLLGGTQGVSGLTSTLVTPSSMVVWPGGQNITVADIGFEPTSGPQSPVQLLTLQSLNASVNASQGSVSVTGVNVGSEEITFTAPSPGTTSGAFTLANCGTTGVTVEPGITAECASTLTYNGSGSSTQTATFTLNGNVSLDNSTLGNKIQVSGTPNVPVGQFVNNGPANGLNQTATLTNVGLGSLNISNIAIQNIFGGATFTGGTCSTATSLSANQSCTLVFTFSNPASDYVNIQITDNNDGIRGTVQSVSAHYVTAVGSVPSSGTTCNGVYDGTFSGNVTVSSGQNCIFVGGGVTNNVQMSGGNLVLSQSKVGNDVQINGGGTFTIGPGSTIGNNLQIHGLPAGPGQNQICGTTVQGDLQFHNNGTAVLIGALPPASCAGNTVGGNLQVQNNSAATTVVGNTVRGNLDDSGNTAATQVFNNVVTNNLTCKQDSSITGGGNTANSKQGQCSAY